MSLMSGAAAINTVTLSGSLRQTSFESRPMAHVPLKLFYISIRQERKFIEVCNNYIF